jgi:hypothetical protein
MRSYVLHLLTPYLDEFLATDLYCLPHKRSDIGRIFGFLRKLEKIAVKGTVSILVLDFKKACNFKAIHPSNFDASCLTKFN